MDLQGTALESTEEFNARIRKVLERATEADTAFKRSLRMAAELDSPNDNSFNTDARHDIAVTADAERAAELLRGGADKKVSEAELAKANELLGEHGDDDVFATVLMNELGPEGLMQQAGRISAVLGPHDCSDDLVREMYGNLGDTLATATEGSNEHHVDDAWVAEFKEQGARTFVVGPTGVEVPGYTLISPAFTSGRYDPDFIAPVTAHMMALNGGTGWKADWHPAFDDSRPGVHTPNGPVQGSPVNAALIALDGNPAAATELFAHGLGNEYVFDNAGGDRVEIDPLDYVLRSANGSAEVGIDPDIAGNTIEAAATGVSSDSELSGAAALPIRTGEMAHIAERTIEYVGRNPEAFEAEDSRAHGMIDNFADIGANYMNDIHRSFMTPEDSVQLPRPDGAHASFGPLEHKGQHDLRQFLQVVGQDSQASARLWGAGKATAYLNAEYAAQTVSDLHLHSDMGDGFIPHGHLTAELVNGRFEAAHDGNWKTADNLDAINKGVNLAAGPATSPMSPLPANLLGASVSMGGDFLVGAAESEVEKNTWLGHAAINDKMETQFRLETQDLVDQILKNEGRGDSGSVREITDNVLDAYNGKTRPDTDREGREFGG